MEAVLLDYRTAPMSEPLRAMLAFLEVLTLHPETLSREHLAPLRQQGLDDAAIEEATAVAAAFAVINRVADGLGFELSSPEGFEASARMLLTRGYR